MSSIDVRTQFLDGGGAHTVLSNMWYAHQWLCLYKCMSKLVLYSNSNGRKSDFSVFKDYPEVVHHMMLTIMECCSMCIWRLWRKKRVHPTENPFSCWTPDPTHILFIPPWMWLTGYISSSLALKESFSFIPGLYTGSRCSTCMYEPGCFRHVQWYMQQKGPKLTESSVDKRLYTQCEGLQLRWDASATGKPQQEHFWNEKIIYFGFFTLQKINHQNIIKTQLLLNQSSYRDSSHTDIFII